jgi:hypothetical protein
MLPSVHFKFRAVALENHLGVDRFEIFAQRESPTDACYSEELFKEPKPTIVRQIRTIGVSVSLSSQKFSDQLVR